MSLSVPYTLVFMPNGQHSPMHIGHLWLLIYMRRDYDLLHTNTSMFETRWELFLDGAFNHHMETFEEELAYLGWPPDSVQLYSDWEVLTLQYLGWLHREQSAGGRCGDASAHLYRLLYFRERGVRRHYRGEELGAASTYERQLANLMGWPYPQVVIVPNLCDEAGVKIGTAGGTAPEYLVATYRDRGVPSSELIDRLIEYVGEPTILHTDAGPVCPAQGLRTHIPRDWFQRA